jgi:hypothetical protein
LPSGLNGVFVAMGTLYPVAGTRTRGQARGVDDLDAQLERAIAALLEHRRPDASICPSEAARAVDRHGWRELMPAARAAAGRLAAAGAVEVTQAGRVVDVATARGPVRVRRPATGGAPAAGGRGAGG